MERGLGGGESGRMGENSVSGVWLASRSLGEGWFQFLETRTRTRNYLSDIGSWIVDNLQGGDNMAIDKQLLDILACPKCKGPVILEEAGAGLVCDACRLRYRIEDDIPIMLIDEAEEI